MKKLVSIMILVLCTLSISAQEKDVTKFLGIPVDGYKAEMKKKLIEKGFTYNAQGDYLEGEFNGYDVRVQIVTNNNKVWRIVIHDKIHQNEASIRNRFNNLCRQFEKNERYLTPEDFTISEDDDISYEMNVHNKLYAASYFQKPNSESINTLLNKIEQEMLNKYTEKQLQNPTKEIEEERERIQEERGIELYFKKTVWFCIHEFEGEYFISMYYDNEYNHADGEDL